MSNHPTSFEITGDLLSALDELRSIHDAVQALQARAAALSPRLQSSYAQCIIGEVQGLAETVSEMIDAETDHITGA